MSRSLLAWAVWDAGEAWCCYVRPCRLWQPSFLCGRLRLHWPLNWCIFIFASVVNKQFFSKYNLLGIRSKDPPDKTSSGHKTLWTLRPLHTSRRQQSSYVRTYMQTPYPTSILHPTFEKYAKSLPHFYPSSTPASLFLTPFAILHRSTFCAFKLTHILSYCLRQVCSGFYVRRVFCRDDVLSAGSYAIPSIDWYECFWGFIAIPVSLEISLPGFIS